MIRIHVERHAEDRMPGTTALMGGKVVSEEIMAALRSAALPKKKRHPKIAVILSSKNGAAAAKREAFEDSYRNGKLDPSIEHYFESYGFEPVFIPITVDNHEDAARDQKLVDDIDRCDAVYLCGGDQAKHVRCLLTPEGADTPVMSAIRRVRERNGLLSGSSAGAAAQGSIMYGVGRSYTYLVENRLDIREIREGTLEHPKKRELGSLGAGLGSIGALRAIVCTHFDESYRLGRLMVALKEARRAGVEMIGVGLDEDTGIVVSGGVGRVHGKSGVFIVDAGDAEYGDREHFEARGVRLHHLTRGDVFDFADREVVASEERELREPGKERELSTKDFLRPHAATRLIEGLIDTRSKEAIGHTRERDPGFTFTFTKDARTKTWRGREEHDGAISELRVDVEAR